MAKTLQAQPGAMAADTPDPRRWWVLVAMVFGLFMPMLDNLVVNVALPTIQRELGSGVSGLQWIIDAYTLTFASFMLTGGRSATCTGESGSSSPGLGVFVLGSLMCGLSQDIGRAHRVPRPPGPRRGDAAPGTLSIITATFTGKERGAAIGIWAAMSGLAIALGPLIGGWLVEHVSWESIFFINVPIGIVGATLAFIVVKESRDPTKSRGYDLPGLVTGTAGLFFLVYGLIEGNERGWTDGLILAAFVLAAVLLVTFFVIESRRKYPMLPLSCSSRYRRSRRRTSWRRRCSSRCSGRRSSSRCTSRTSAASPPSRPHPAASRSR